MALDGNFSSRRWLAGLLVGVLGSVAVLAAPTPDGLRLAAVKALAERLPPEVVGQLSAEVGPLGSRGLGQRFAKLQALAAEIPLALDRRDGRLIGAAAYQALPASERRHLEGPLSLAELVERSANAARRTLAVAVLMIAFWIFVVLPVPVTALLPVLLFPLLGVASIHKTVFPGYFSIGSQYGHHLIFLFMGAFMLSKAMMRWQLDRRIALYLLGAFGSRPSLLLLGFIVATALLSMWISNTASAAMMVPIALAVVERVEHPRARRYRVGVLLAVAYAASLGGVGSLVGSPPNAIFAGFAASLVGHQVGFVEWLRFGLPFLLLMLPLLWGVMAWRYIPSGLQLPSRGLLAAPGPFSPGEKRVAGVFLLMVLLWLTRSPLEALGWPGWSALRLGGVHLGLSTDATVALFGVILLFLVPVEPRRGLFLLDLRSGFDISWGTLILFGGGLSLGEAMGGTGLAHWLAGLLGGASAAGPAVLLLGVAFFASLLTEITSNTASATMLMPILYALGQSLGGGELALMATGAVACSLAFMLPIATPPNAIVFGTGKLSMGEMFRTGILLDVLAVLVWWAVASVAF